jgi:hypothetical protein
MKIKSKQYKRWNAWSLIRIFNFIISPTLLFLKDNFLIFFSAVIVWTIIFLFLSFKQEIAWKKLTSSIIEGTEEY